MRTASKPAISRGDRVSIVAFMVAGIALVAWTVVQAVVRVMEVLPARNPLRGRMFSRRNTALAATAGISGLVGFALALQVSQGNGFVASFKDPATRLGFLHASYGMHDQQIAIQFGT